MLKRAPIPEDKCFERCAALNKISPEFGAVHLARHDEFEGSIALVTNILGFDAFPSEILQEIAVYLPDKDLKSFSLVQRAARDAVVPANAGHWRQRFRDQYDLPPGKSPAAIKEDYILRKRFLAHRIRLKYGQSPDEVACLKAIRQLIVEVPKHSRGSSSLELELEPDASPSLNVRQLWRFMKKSNLLHDAFRWTRSETFRTNRLLQIIQVFFFGWNVYCATHDLPGAFPYSLRLTAYAMDESEACALAPPSRDLVDAKVTAGRNAYNTYLTSGADTGVHAYPYVSGGDRLLDLTFKSVSDNGRWPMAFEKEIRAHSSRFSNDKKFVNPPMQSSPGLEPSEEACSRHCTKISTTSNADSESNDLPGPQRWTTNTEKNLRSSEGQPSSSTANAGFVEEKHFFGLGEYDVMEAPLNTAGLVHPLPPQDGIPGWQRFTMVSYRTPGSGSPEEGYLDAKEADIHAAALYEGVMLPGNSVIIGRYSEGDEYWDDAVPDKFLQRGTFIYWLAPDDASDDDDDNGAEHDDGDAEAEND
ncbi:MAG: hypothetical protein LQ349_007902 [Xanthoria aureola]|nr:MAG: hypothetical protein LQ349_007902 [Xanthoria aureola]